MVIRLTKLLGSLVVRLLDQIKALTRRSFGKKRRKTCVVLYYHVVREEQRGMFAKQMDQLLKYCKPIPISKLADLKAAVHHAAVTFDDGFCSALQNALPELEARNIPVTFFVSSSYLGQRPSWNGVEQTIKDHEFVLNPQQIRQVREHALVSVGSHCMTHSDLSRLEDHQARDEIFGSKIQLENMLDEEIRLLSFPFGSFTETHVKLAQEARYSRVFTTSPELLSEDHSQKYVVGRVRVDPTDWPLEFRLKVLGAYRWLPFAFSLKRKLRFLFGNRSNIAKSDRITSAN